jgi:hypothetical protein
VPDGVFAPNTRIVTARLRLPSAAECARFERESFGALSQMLAGLPEEARAAVWDEVETGLRQFAEPNGFDAPSEFVVGVGQR